MEKPMSTEEKQPSPEGSAEPEEPSTQTEGAPPGGDDSKDTSHELLEQINLLQQENKTLRDKSLRAIAEMENFRKRALRDKEEARRYANAALVEELLPVIDNFTIGLAAADNSEHGKPFAQGFAMILTQIRNVLQQNGVEEIDPKGEPFDPNLHESIGHQASDEFPEGTVMSVERVGYRLHARLIRPASVVVSKGSVSENNAKTESTGTESDSE